MVRVVMALPVPGPGLVRSGPCAWPCFPDIWCLCRVSRCPGSVPVLVQGPWYGPGMAIKGEALVPDPGYWLYHYIKGLFQVDQGMAVLGL